MKKEDFIAKIKKEISSEEGFPQILEVFAIPQKERNERIFKLIEQGIEMIQKENRLAPNYFLAISELPFIQKNIRGFCIDATLVAEHDFNGEFKSVDELLKKFSEIKTR